MWPARPVYEELTYNESHAEYLALVARNRRKTMEYRAAKWHLIPQPLRTHLADRVRNKAARTLVEYRHIWAEQRRFFRDMKEAAALIK